MMGSKLSVKAIFISLSLVFALQVSALAQIVVSATIVSGGGSVGLEALAKRGGGNGTDRGGRFATRNGGDLAGTRLAGGNGVDRGGRFASGGGDLGGNTRLAGGNGTDRGGRSSVPSDSMLSV